LHSEEAEKTSAHLPRREVEKQKKRGKKKDVFVGCLNGEIKKPGETKKVGEKIWRARRGGEW